MKKRVAKSATMSEYELMLIACGGMAGLPANWREVLEERAWEPELAAELDEMRRAYRRDHAFIHLARQERVRQALKKADREHAKAIRRRTTSKAP